MQNRTRYIAIGSFVLIAAGGGVAACADSSPFSQNSEVATAPVFSAQASSALLVCPNTVVSSATAVIGDKGGTVTLDGHSLAIPAGAVQTPTRFTMTELASDYVKVRIQADDLDTYTFRKDVKLTLSYARCGNAAQLKNGALSIKRVDGETDQILEGAPSVNVPGEEAVQARIDHLSRWVIAT